MQYDTQNVEEVWICYNCYMKRIERYLQEAHKHIVAIDEAFIELPKLPLHSLTALSKLQRFAVEIIIFRFSKLQDLLGTKLFRQFLEELGYITEGKSYLELLKELQKRALSISIAGRNFASSVMRSLMNICWMKRSSSKRSVRLLMKCTI